METQQHPVLLFDGVCNLCNGFVQFVIKRDPQARFRFAALQSEEGQKLLEHLNYSGRENLDTVILVQQEKVYTHSDVAIQVVRKLPGLWPALAVFGIIPKGIRDRIYNWVARNRYKWFGQRASCMIPTPDLQKRFL